jgi:hypothetical protein
MPGQPTEFNTKAIEEAKARFEAMARLQQVSPFVVGGDPNNVEFVKKMREQIEHDAKASRK